MSYTHVLRILLIKLLPISQILQSTFIIIIMIHFITSFNLFINHIKFILISISKIKIYWSNLYCWSWRVPCFIFNNTKSYPFKVTIYIFIFISKTKYTVFFLWIDLYEKFLRYSSSFLYIILYITLDVVITKMHIYQSVKHTIWCNLVQLRSSLILTPCSTHTLM